MNWYTEEEHRAAFYKKRRRKEIEAEYLRAARRESLRMYIFSALIVISLAAVVLG